MGTFTQNPNVLLYTNKSCRAVEPALARNPRRNSQKCDQIRDSTCESLPNPIIQKRTWPGKECDCQPQKTSQKQQSMKKIREGMQDSPDKIQELGQSVFTSSLLPPFLPGALSCVDLHFPLILPDSSLYFFFSIKANYGLLKVTVPLTLEKYD